MGPSPRLNLLDLQVTAPPGEHKEATRSSRTAGKQQHGEQAHCGPRWAPRPCQLHLRWQGIGILPRGERHGSAWQLSVTTIAAAPGAREAMDCFGLLAGRRQRRERHSPCMHPHAMIVLTLPLVLPLRPRPICRSHHHQVCRCLPFIHRLHRTEEVISLGDLRKIVKQKILEFKDVKDPRVRPCTRPCRAMDAWSRPGKR
jgi:hypothetical protein